MPRVLSCGCFQLHMSPMRLTGARAMPPGLRCAPIRHAHVHAKAHSAAYSARRGSGTLVPQVAPAAREQQHVPSDQLMSMSPMGSRGSGSSSNSSSPGDGHSGFALSANELQTLVAAAVDSSQASAAEGILEVLEHRVGDGCPCLLPAAIAAALRSDVAGGLLPGVPDAPARAAAFGRNELPAPPNVSLLQLLVEAASDGTLLLLTAAGILSLVLAVARGGGGMELIDGGAILVSVALCVGVAAGTNAQKEAKFRALSELRDDVAVRVLRGGREERLSCRALLAGDVLLLEAGDVVPADGLLVSAGGSVR
jgi:Cation transporter/ATPase, N-terminus